MIWALTGAAAALYWALSLSDKKSVFKSLVKGLSVLPLAVYAGVQGAPLVVLALALCSIGDVILSRPAAGAFLGGLIAFALGHLAWIAVFIWSIGIDPSLLLAPHSLVLIAGFAALAIVMVRVLLPRAGPLRMPVTAYIGIIIAMGITALATPSGLAIAGAVLFAASDTFLGLQHFVLVKVTRRERIANLLIWPLYWVAIVFLTLGTLPL